jgi:hypothetical protein
MPIYRQLSAIITIAWFIGAGLGRISGCDDVECAPSTQVVFPNVCSYAEDGVGITSFNSKISQKPLTWTVRGEGGYPATNNSESSNFPKTFHLGTPEDLKLLSAAFRGCSFLFSNISTTLQVEDGFDDWSKFSCDTFWGSECTQDTLSQAWDTLNKAIALDPPLSTLVTCVEIRNALQGNFAKSCQLPDKRSSWGSVVEQG